MKAWNKLHDMDLSTLINDNNWGCDILGIQGSPIYTIYDLMKTPTAGVLNNQSDRILIETWLKQATVGRTQYSMSLEGEELGETKSLISGKQAQTPFDMLISATKTQTRMSYINIFIKYDFVLRIEQDLTITISGR